MATLSVALIQSHCTPDPRATEDRLYARAEDAVARGARLVVLPELYASMVRGEELAARAEPVPGPATDRWAALARACGVWLCCGSVIEQSGMPGRYFNTAVLLDPEGRIAAAYRKIHLFDVDAPGLVQYHESRFFLAGDAPGFAAAPFGGIGLAICYDLRFPELFRALADRGADLLLVPSAFSRGTGAAHWETLVRARAIENQAFVLAANQVGVAPNGFESYGHSLIVDPWGRVLAQGGAEECCVSAALDFEELARVRRTLPTLAHRRRDLFRCSMSGPAEGGNEPEA